LKVMLNEMSWVEAKRYFMKNDIAVVPVGSNEQHGPHNPLGTDHFIAREIAKRAAEQAGVVCLEVVPFGVSSHHRQFWGTVHVSARTLKKYMREVCLALNYYGVTKIVVVNGHGGNFAVLSELARDLRERGIFMAVFQWWHAAGELLPELFTRDERRHASAEETSVNLALRPKLVDMKKATDEKVPDHPTEGAGNTVPLDAVDFTKCGVYGKSTTASARKGRQVLGAVVTELARQIRVLKKMKMDDLTAKPRV
jgi:creatinine amidohydrolase